MPTAQRNIKLGVIDQLLSEPYRADFFQAINMIALWLKQNGIEHDKVFDYLRFQNRLSLAFPPSQIEALVAQADTPIRNAGELLAALREKRLRHIAITPTFFGLLGLYGSMPLHYTESIAEDLHYVKDSGSRAFLDLFSNRSTTLLYQAWAKYRPECMCDVDGRDTLLPILLAIGGVRPRPPDARAERDERNELAGAGPPADPGASAAERADIDAETAAFYAAQFRSRRVSADSVAAVLSEYFAVPIALEQLVGCWTALPPEHQAALGSSNAHLGAGMVLGARIFSLDQRVRLRIGPLDRAMHDRFIPGAPWAKALNAMLGMFCGAGLTFEVRVLLRRDAARGIKLHARDGARLGIDAALLTLPARRDRDDLAYLLRP